MKKQINEEQLRINAKRKIKQIQIFYLHLVLYLIVMALIFYNFYIIEEGHYKNNIMALNFSVIVVWSVFITLHGLVVFKGKQIFKKRWEDEKIKEFLEKEEAVKTTFWE